MPVPWIPYSYSQCQRASIWMSGRYLNLDTSTPTSHLPPLRVFSILFLQLFKPISLFRLFRVEHVILFFFFQNFIQSVDFTFKTWILLMTVTSTLICSYCLTFQTNSINNLSSSRKYSVRFSMGFCWVYRLIWVENWYFYIYLSYQWWWSIPYSSQSSLISLNVFKKIFFHIYFATICLEFSISMLYLLLLQREALKKQKVLPNWLSSEYKNAIKCCILTQFLQMWGLYINSKKFSINNVIFFRNSDGFVSWLPNIFTFGFIVLEV